MGPGILTVQSHTGRHLRHNRTHTSPSVTCIAASEKLVQLREVPFDSFTEVMVSPARYGVSWARAWWSCITCARYWLTYLRVQPHEQVT